MMASVSPHKSLYNTLSASVAFFPAPTVSILELHKTSIVKNRNYARPITKCGPNLLGSESSVAAIRYAGFNCCTLANNHILDQGKQCCLDTIGNSKFTIE